MKSPASEHPPLKVLMLTLVFHPDGVSTAYIMTKLALELRRQGIDVVVVTTTPHYNLDTDALAAQPLTRKWDSIVMESRCGDIPVYHVRVGRKGSRVLKRALDYVFFHLMGTLAAIRLGGDYDVILAPSPPLTIGLSAFIAAAWRGVPFIYNVQEIFPDSLVKVGVLKSRVVIRFFEGVEKLIYRLSARVVVISESFRRQLAAKGVREEKIEIIPNFVDLELIHPGERHNPFSAEHALDSKFVVSYSGNIGLTQDFDSIIETARQLLSTPQVHLLIIGDGSRREWLVRELEAQRLANVTLLPYQRKSVVPLIYASSDICLVPLRSGSALGTFPSKIYTIMGAARPVLVSADADSDLVQVTRDAQCGIVVPPSDPRELAAGILKAYENRVSLRQMGLNGREFVLRRYAPEVVAGQYARLLSSVAHKGSAE